MSLRFDTEQEAPLRAKSSPSLIFSELSLLEIEGKVWIMWASKEKNGLVNELL